MPLLDAFANPISVGDLIITETSQFIRPGGALSEVYRVTEVGEYSVLATDYIKIFDGFLRVLPEAEQGSRFHAENVLVVTKLLEGKDA